MSRSTISTFQLFSLFPDEKAARVRGGNTILSEVYRCTLTLEREMKT
jgi:hypothetical protein